MAGILVIIIAVIVVVQFVYASRLMKFRFSTLRSLLDFIEKERINLGEKDYKQLVNRYSGITRLYEPFPGRESYPVLYSNTEFESFVIEAKKKTKYYILVTATGFIILAAVASWLESNPIKVAL